MQAVGQSSMEEMLFFLRKAQRPKVVTVDLLFHHHFQKYYLICFMLSFIKSVCQAKPNPLVSQQDFVVMYKVLLS